MTYVVTAINFGPSDAAGATVSDSFPASLDCSWKCFASFGASCAASGAGDIAQSIDLPAQSTASFFAICNLNASASGTLTNTATISPPAGTGDPATGNDSATDTDTISAAATAVPALDNTILVELLVTLLAGAGWILLRRH